MVVKEGGVRKGGRRGTKGLKEEYEKEGEGCKREEGGVQQD